MALKGLEKSLDSHLWHACAGGMVQMPPLNSKVVFFPQGYAEHAQGNVEFGSSLKIPPLILCRVDAIKYLADPETDEVFAKLGLVPLRCVGGNLEDDDGDDDDDGVVVENNGIEGFQKPVSFAKTLTQSDANNGGGFSVPRYCAETIFPRLDYRAEPPVQTILAKDVHGETWKFRHIYRGTPRRHLLTTGWSNFVNRKKLIAGDSIVFLRAENGDLCVGIRRAKRGINGGYSLFWREDESNFLQANSNWCSGERGKVTGESVVEAAALAAIGRPFEAVYYPRGSSPEFCVKASAVRAAMRVQWGCGMRFKMAFETEDSSRVSWFMGAISSVQVADPVRWPNSPWRLLQVTWDEPDLLQNVKRVSPWLVEVVSNVPAIHLSPFSPPRKKLRLPQHPDFSLLSQLPVPSFPHINPLRPSTPFCYNPPSIQGARHSHVGLFSPRPLTSGPNNTHDENISCLLTMGNSNPTLSRNSQEKTQPLPQFVLFGQPILTEEQISQSCSNDTNGRSVSDGSTERTANTEETPFYKDHQNTKMGTDMGHRKVSMESENAGRVLDLPVGSYEELYRKIADVWHKKIRDAEEYAAMGQGGGYC